MVVRDSIFTTTALLCQSLVQRCLMLVFACCRQVSLTAQGNKADSDKLVSTLQETAVKAMACTGSKLFSLFVQRLVLAAYCVSIRVAHCTGKLPS